MNEADAAAGDVPRRPQQAARVEARRAPARALAAPLAASVALHAIVVVVLAWLVSGGTNGLRPAFKSTPLHATLASPPQRFVVPKPEPAPAPVEPSPRSVRPAEHAAPLPVPIAPPRKEPVEQGAPHGQVTIRALPADEGARPEIEAHMRQRYPEAVRTHVQFDVAPEAEYPKQALAERRQLHLVLPAVVHADGRIELAEGTFEDPVYAPVIRAALEKAKAQPPERDGAPQTGWVLVEFLFEYLGLR